MVLNKLVEKDANYHGTDYSLSTVLCFTLFIHFSTIDNLDFAVCTCKVCMLMKTNSG